MKRVLRFIWYTVAALVLAIVAVNLIWVVLGLLNN